MEADEARGSLSPGARAGGHLRHRLEHDEGAEHAVRPQGQSLAGPAEQGLADDSTAATAVCQLELQHAERTAGLECVVGVRGRRRDDVVYGAGRGRVRLRRPGPPLGTSQRSAWRGVHLSRPPAPLLGGHRRRSVCLQPAIGTESTRGELRVRHVQRYDHRPAGQPIFLDLLTRLLQLQPADA